MKKKVNKKEETKKAIARKKLVNELVEKFDLVENAQNKFETENSKNFRIASVAIYDALNTKSVFKSVRHLATEMNRSKSDVARYFQAGKFLKGVTDEQLKKVGFNAYKVKTELRKIKSSMQVKTAEDLKKASEQNKVTRKVATCNHGSIDGLNTLLKDLIEHNKDVAKLCAIEKVLEDALKKINSKVIKTPTATPKGKALTKVLVNA